jgi:hypothetical protein
MGIMPSILLVPSPLSHGISVEYAMALVKHFHYVAMIVLALS